MLKGVIEVGRTEPREGAVHKNGNLKSEILGEPQQCSLMSHDMLHRISRSLGDKRVGTNKSIGRVNLVGNRNISIFSTKVDAGIKLFSMLEMVIRRDSLGRC